MQRFRANQEIESLRARCALIEAQVHSHAAAVKLVMDGLSSFYRDQRFTHYERAISALALLARTDRALRLPHRKILDALAGHFDSNADVFVSVPFSVLVREARVGKRLAGAYLRDLCNSGYVVKDQCKGYVLVDRVRPGSKPWISSS